jgi:hypothetical protein
LSEWPGIFERYGNRLYFSDLACRSPAGSLSDPSSLTPEFFFNAGVTDSIVLLTVEAAGGYGCPVVYDTLELSVIPLPVVYAGIDTFVCETGSVEITGVVVQDYFNYSWSVNGMELWIIIPLLIRSIHQVSRIFPMAA